MNVTENSAIVEKSKALCQAILSDPVYQQVQTSVQTFMKNEPAQVLYRNLSQKGSDLQQKHQQGITLTDQEIADFEKDREAFFKNPIAKDYVDSQETLHGIKKTIMQFVAKTLETGVIPTFTEIQEAGCEHNCGCHD